MGNSKNRSNRYITVKLLYFLLLWQLPLVAAAANDTSDIDTNEIDTIVVPLTESDDINHEGYYFIRLLKLALSKTIATNGSFQVKEYHTVVVDDLLRQTLQSGDIDVIWSNTSSHYDCDLQPVGYSLLKDLSNYRLLLIRGDDQPRFDQVNSRSDLAKLTGGMGEQWPDIAIMKQNKLPLVTAPGYEEIFKMLSAKRFDYFSRGIYQIQTESERRPHLRLVIEKNLLLHYPNTFRFFVHRHNSALADRLSEGLRLAQLDGSFDMLFNSIPRYRWGIDELRNGSRKLIELTSPKSATELGPCKKGNLAKHKILPQ
ncbi:hypothetical protein [Teredinibacter waterburyi]|uniref:hypothetical protein n=1 Tax=Teredinibacter waterburyi TaxID=1500538 RepID=UPI00165F0B0D|nr:hypothetical protein [Teredinibacter waterburyi]